MSPVRSMNFTGSDMETVANITHSDSEQIISALTKHRTFEISIGTASDGFYAEVVYPQSDGENILKELRGESAVSALLESIRFIEKVLEGDRVFDDETYIEHIYLEGKCQYVSLKDMSTLIAEGQIGCLVGKL